MKTAFSFLLMAASLFTLGSTAAYAQDQFGAISYSSQTTAYSISGYHETQGLAEVAAQRICESEAGTGDCRVLLWFKNACGSIAGTANGDVGTGWGVNRQVAGSFALDSCESNHDRLCRVLDTLCIQ